MTPVDRLVRTRQQQRDSAAEELARAQARLQELQQEQERLTQESRDELQQAVGTDGLTIASLETMDAGRRQAERAATTGEAVLEDARRAALEYQRMLRQVEILRQRILERRGDEERRRERRVLDEIASRRRGGGLLGLALVVAVGLGVAGGLGGCRSEEKHKDEETADAGHEAGTRTSTATLTAAPIAAPARTGALTGTSALTVAGTAPAESWRETPAPTGRASRTR